MNLYFWQSIISFALIYGLFGIAVYVNLAAGLLSFATIPIGAVSGFFAAWLFDSVPLPTPVMVVIGTVLGVAASAVVFEVVKRLASHYLAMATLALLLVVEVIVLNIPEITGGVRGRTVNFPVDFWSILVVLAIVAVLMQRLRGSALWLAFSALRADVDVAAGIGVDRVRSHRVSFLLSGGIAGAAGVLLAGALQYIDPHTYGIPLLFVVLPAAVLGGTYLWVGPLVGALVLQAIPAAFSDFTTSAVQVVVGILILLIVLFLPGGVVSDSWKGLGKRLGISPRVGGRAEPAAIEKEEE